MAYQMLKTAFDIHQLNNHHHSNGVVLIKCMLKLRIDSFLDSEILRRREKKLKILISIFCRAPFDGMDGFLEQFASANSP